MLIENVAKLNFEKYKLINLSVKIKISSLIWWKCTLFCWLVSWAYNKNTSYQILLENLPASLIENKIQNAIKNFYWSLIKD